MPAPPIDLHSPASRALRPNVPRLHAAVAAAGLDCVLVMSLENFRYLATASIEIQRAIKERIGAVVWPASGDPALVVRSGEVSRIREETWIPDVRPYHEFGPSPMSVLAGVLREKGMERATIGLEKVYLNARYYEELISLLPGARFVDAQEALDRAKVVKTAAELELLREPWRSTEAAAEVGFLSAREGDREADVAATMKYELTRAGAETLPFLMLASGARSCHIHPVPGADRIERGQTVRVDFGGMFEGYVTDVARMAVVGEASRRQLDVYGRLVQVRDDMIARIRPGVATREVFEATRAQMDALGIPLDKDHLGHSVGTAVHEWPFIRPEEDAVYEPGMVTTIEPSHIEPGVARYHIEDLVIVRASGAELVTDVMDVSRMVRIR